MFRTTASIYTPTSRGERGRLVRVLALRNCARSQPQRDVGRLYRLRYYSHQIVVQRLQVFLVPQSGREGFQCLPRVVPTAVEPAVYKRLVAMTQWAEQRCYHLGRDDYGELGLLLLAGKAAEERLGRRHTPEVHERQHPGERSINQGTVYDHVYVEEACT